MHARFVRIARSRTVVNIQNLIDDLKCFETVRELRWPQGVTCPHCDSAQITKQGHDSTQPERQRYRCQACQKHFDDLTGTDLRRPSPTVAGLDPLPLFHGAESLE